MAVGSFYTDEQRREAVAHNVVLGNWRFARQRGAELDGQLTRIIHKATDQLLDRLDNGDAVLVGGEVKRKPIST